jgi:type II secretory pathway predicted ATPase ExeA/phage tail protein X
MTCPIQDRRIAEDDQVCGGDAGSPASRPGTKGTMYLERFRLREEPFGVTPDPRFLYSSDSHREALCQLRSAIERGRGFLALVAEPGMGKTTLAYQLLHDLGDATRTLFLFQTQCDSRELFRYLLSGLGAAPINGDIVAMHEKLNEILARESLAGRRFLLVLDEAHNLSESVLETVRLLSDFETPSAKLVQILLIGQPQLARKLSDPELAQLRQRLATVAQLEPLSSSESLEYVHHRLHVAGYAGAPLFTVSALERIAHLSGGIPRVINNICSNALEMADACGRDKVDSSLVEEAALLLSLEFPRRRLTLPRSAPPWPVSVSEPQPGAPTRESELWSPAASVKCVPPPGPPVSLGEVAAAAAPKEQSTDAEFPPAPASEPAPVPQVSASQTPGASQQPATVPQESTPPPPRILAESVQPKPRPRPREVTAPSWPIAFVNDDRAPAVLSSNPGPARQAPVSQALSNGWAGGSAHLKVPRQYAPHLAVVGTERRTAGVAVGVVLALVAVVALGWSTFDPVQWWESRTQAAAASSDAPSSVVSADSQKAAVAATSSGGSASAPADSGVVSSPSAAGRIQTVNAITITVQPNQTLQQICMQYYGRYDESLLRQIRDLNPGITNLDHIEAGQELWLPAANGQPNINGSSDTQSKTKPASSPNP